MSQEFNLSYRSDPKIVGPGKWDIIHTEGFKAKTNESQRRFIELVEEICREFKCEVCHGHCTKYIKDHPPSNYIGKEFEFEGVKEKLGMFVWSWEFHNSVNIRLGKPHMNYETAYYMYSTEEKCQQVCGL